MTWKIAFFEGWSWLKFNNLGLALGTNLKFCTSVGKELKLKKILWHSCFSSEFRANFKDNFFTEYLWATVSVSRRSEEQKFPSSDIWFLNTSLRMQVKDYQKQPSRGVLWKRCSSENMQQIYRRTPVPMHDFKKLVLQLYRNRTLTCVLL